MIPQLPDLWEQAFSGSKSFPSIWEQSENRAILRKIHTITASSTTPRCVRVAEFANRSPARVRRIKPQGSGNNLRVAIFSLFCGINDAVAVERGVNERASAIIYSPASVDTYSIKSRSVGTKMEIPYRRATLHNMCQRFHSCPAPSPKEPSCGNARLITPQVEGEEKGLAGLLGNASSEILPTAKCFPDRAYVYYVWYKIEINLPGGKSLGERADVDKMQRGGSRRGENSAKTRAIREPRARVDIIRIWWS